MIGLFIAGVICMLNLRREIFPPVSTDVITVSTLDVTLDSPEDVERLVTVPIEDQLRAIEDVKEIHSVSSPNLSIIFLKLYDNAADVQTVLNEVRQEVDEAKTDLPKTSESPVTIEQKFPFPVIIVGLSYQPGMDLLKIKKLVDRLQNQFESIQGVSEVDVRGLSDREIWVEVDPFRAHALNISLQDISRAINVRNKNIPGGVIKGDSGETTIRVLEQIDEDSWRDLVNVVVQNNKDKIIRLGDVATIHNTFEEEKILSRVNGRPAITFTINKRKTGDTIAIDEKVRKFIGKAETLLPDSVSLSFYSDSAKYVKKRMSTMVRNGIISMTLVAVMLLLFMNWRISLLVVAGLLVSFFGAFIYLKLINNSFNMISLFSLILVLGMLVDDAIVVCENVYRHMENGKSPFDAAIIGTKEVVLPVIGTVSTTVVAFLPLLLTTGIMGKFVAIIPQVITVALLLSLVEVIFILPSHLVDFVKPEDTGKHTLTAKENTSFISRTGWSITNFLRKVRRGVDSLLSRVLEYYRYALKTALRCRWIVIFAAILAFFSALMIVKTGILRFKLFDANYADRIMIYLEAPPYYTLEKTTAAVNELEKDIISNMPVNDTAAVISAIGVRPESETIIKRGSNEAYIIFDVDELNPGCRKPMPIVRDLRRIINKHSEFIMTKVEKEQGGPPVGKAVTIRILGDDFNQMKKIAEEYKAYLSTIPGVTDISDDFDNAKREVHIDVDEDKIAIFGGDVSEVGEAIMSAFKGSEVSVFRWGNDEVTVRVKYSQDLINNIEDIKDFKAVSKTGNLIMLSDIAKVSRSYGFGEIKRLDRKRLITVYADVDGKRITSKEANDKIKALFTGKQLKKQFPDCSVTYGGEEEETNESLRSMAIAGIVAFILIFAILAGVLNSFIQPFLILSIIPLGFVGVVYGFMIFQLPIGFMALMGTIGLVGIIVNDSIVMVSFINEYRSNWQNRHGMGDRVRTSSNRHITNKVRWASLMKSGLLRFRPIFLTTVTTIAGMSTIAFTRSGQEQFIAPMALAIICGLSLGTAVTLFITPCVYAILDDIEIFFFGKGEIPMEANRTHDLSDINPK